MAIRNGLGMYHGHGHRGTDTGTETENRKQKQKQKQKHGGEGIRSTIATGFASVRTLANPVASWIPRIFVDHSVAYQIAASCERSPVVEDRLRRSASR
jgi:hypothetical protein